MRQALVVACVIALGASGLHAQTAPAAGYLEPPKVIVDMLDAAPPPRVVVSPARDRVAILDRDSMPRIAELAQPMLRLAGVRINPRTNGPHRTEGNRAITYRALAIETIADGARLAVTLPPDPRISWVGFSPDGARFAFTQTRDTGIELWVGDAATGEAKAVTAAQLNASLGTPCSWIGDGASLVCRFVVPSRGAEPAPPAVPSGPNVQENRGKVAPVRTYEDLLTSAHDDALFEYYATSQLATVDAATGQRAPVGRPGIFRDVEASPDGRFFLAVRVNHPFSRLVEYDDFPATVEILDARGIPVRTVAELPLADNVPIGGVMAGPRRWQWNAAQPATLAWVEALDGGDPKNAAPQRDRIVELAAPFTGEPAEVARTEYRFDGIAWTPSGVALVTENDRDRRWTRTWIIERPGAEPRKLWDRAEQDAYSDPGDPLHAGASNDSPLRVAGNRLFLTGSGASPEGARPFVDSLDLSTLATDRLFRSASSAYEQVMDVLSDDGSLVLTRYESRTEPPNVYVRNLKTNERRAITAYTDPATALQGVQKQLVTYKRNDGVALSATILTPPGWSPAQGPLPTLLWAYPREFTDPTLAGQVTGSSQRFTLPGWSTLHQMFLTQGYVIIDDPTMPIVGPGETANDTYVQQLVASAQAAVDRAVGMGVTDRDRVVVGGHSYGAFMTANLLAHSDIFRAGIARSGAYNRTLTPFGFQNERRTFWEVPQIYAAMSPFFHADQVNEPILLIHGEADDNSGTFPIQSERFYMALKGHGATVRYVTLPYEAHGYASRESILDVVAEMLNWSNEFAKNAKPRESVQQQR
ncbi:MAG: prolyl oligopeptidase family serine peptidase [Vicinamibacterales bacterium]